jgi:hypothetical protein
VGLVALIRQREIVRGVPGYAVGFTGPFAKINEFAAFAAEWPPRIVSGPFDFPCTGGTFYSFNHLAIPTSVFPLL